jgi:hypothetical protein
MNEQTEFGRLGRDYMDASAPKKRILILGGGFGGVYAALHLERLRKRRPDVEIVVISQDNFLLMTPLLFEVCSGALDGGLAPGRTEGGSPNRRQPRQG